MRAKAIGLFTLCLLLVMPVFSEAANYSLVVNQFLINPDVPPVVEGRNILVPLRAVAEATGAEVAYDESRRAVIINRQGLAVRIWPGKYNAIKNGSEIFLVQPPQIIQNRTFVTREELAKILDVRTFLSVRLGAVVIEG
ncbi:MAG: Uncharacterized protein XD97_0608 [Pelotomaculum thermopropionicum]|uniref:Copper amine oxidase-like N-terminal domain-containing protein n=1 Tax=Pelotomaculum thermopropionicum TaxID=110500 RepID=A0A117M314_9FIRM|nr:MAG: Uncharacterized protein XD97_0608 [Pelotomaculum thermopropionicum]